MKRILVVCAAIGLAALPVLAADSKIQSSVEVFKATGADAAKLKTFCAMSEAMDAGGEKEDAATDAKIDGYMKQLGPDFETAWNAGEEVDDNSADGKTLNAAIDDLTGKCSG
jgi:hypothetical protein